MLCGIIRTSNVVEVTIITFLKEANVIIEERC